MPQLVNNERSPFTDVITLTVADLAAIAAGGGTKVVARIPRGGAIELAGISTVETFGTSAGAIAATGAVSVGIQALLLSTLLPLSRPPRLPLLPVSTRAVVSPLEPAQAQADWCNLSTWPPLIRMSF